MAVAAATAAEPNDSTPSLLIAEETWYAYNGQQHSVLAGGCVQADVLSGLSLSATYLQGTYHTEGDIETLRDMRLLATKAIRGVSVGGGFRCLAADTRLRSGWEWDVNIPDEKRQRNADILGPVLCAGAERPFGASPLGWSASLLWMPHDFGDFDGLGYDASHVAVEAGLVLSVKRLRAEVGYRFEQFADLPERGLNEVRFNRDELDGVVLGLGVRF